MQEFLAAIALTLIILVVAGLAALYYFGALELFESVGAKLKQWRGKNDTTL